MFHVRSVTQGDVIRADAKDIPRIFQVRIIIVYSNLIYIYIIIKISRFFLYTS